LLFVQSGDGGAKPKEGSAPRPKITKASLAGLFKRVAGPFQLLRLSSAPLRPAQVKAAAAQGPRMTMEIAEGNFQEIHGAVEAVNARDLRGLADAFGVRSS
jgi:hypothetical protein